MTINFKVGSHYVTRGGEKVRCIANDRAYPKYPIVCMNECDGGLLVHTKRGECTTGRLRDIVREAHPFDDVAVDTPIWVRDRTEDAWIARHFAKVENGQVRAWVDGCTSHTIYNNATPTTTWQQVSLTNPNTAEAQE